MGSIVPPASGKYQRTPWYRHLRPLLSEQVEKQDDNRSEGSVISSTGERKKRTSRQDENWTPHVGNFDCLVRWFYGLDDNGGPI